MEGNIASKASDPRFRAEVATIVNDELQSRLKNWRNILIAFLLGLSLFIGIGLTWKDHILKPIFAFLYPPRTIYSDIKQDVAMDNLTYLASEQHEEIKLKNFPTVETEVSGKIVDTIKTDKSLEDRIWETIQTGDKEKFSLLVKSEFGDALIEEFYEQMTLAFETLNPLDRAALVDQIKRKGKVLLPTEFRVLSSDHDGRGSSCGEKIDHEKLQAVVVIPKKASSKMYRWFQCPDTRFPRLYLELQVRNLRLSNIEVVGVIREGESGKIEARVTREVAKEFKWPNWEKYLSRQSGHMKVANAIFD
ncbi:MAG: hypothetical protein OEN50_21015 [Deltaproteobacteria bacterium]|nr:hypothetical protein [Deltaproteobacteria bacterium]